MLSRSVCDAVRALGYLGTSGLPLVIEDLSRGTGLPRPSLAKLMSTLARKGFVTTRRGIGGGVALARPGAAVTLFDLCVALDDPGLAPACLLRGRHTRAGPCPARDLERRHHEEVLAFLKRTSVSEVAAALPGAAPVPMTAR